MTGYLQIFLGNEMAHRKRNGFTLVELLVVIAIFAIMTSIASFAWQRYVNNTNLRTAARDIVSDIDFYRAKSTSESRMYLIAFIPGSNSFYIVYSAATATHPLVYISKYMTPYGSGVNINSVGYTGSWASNWIMFQPRGTVTSGTVTLTNSRSSTATVTSNITGKTFVQFSMH